MAVTAVVLLVLAATFFTAQALVGKACTSEAECDAGECCQILKSVYDMVVSKRDAIYLGPPLQKKTGICKKYRVEGDYCSSIEKANGYCGCGPNLICHSYKVPIRTIHRGIVNRVRRMPMNDPGYTWRSTCEAQLQ